MSNPREAALMKTEAYRQQVAQWIFEGIQTYRRSQELPAESARLRLATADGIQSASTVAGTQPTVPKLEAVPNFRPSSTASATNSVGHPGTPYSAQQILSATSGVSDFRSRKNVPVTAAPSPPKPESNSVPKEPEVRKAVASEPEVRKAIPVDPRKGE